MENNFLTEGLKILKSHEGKHDSLDSLIFTGGWKMKMQWIFLSLILNPEAKPENLRGPPCLTTIPDTSWI